MAGFVGLALVAAAIAIPLTRDDAAPDKREAGGISAAVQAQVEKLTGEEMVRTRSDSYEVAAGHNQDIYARTLIEQAMQTMTNIIARLDYSGEYPTSEYTTLIREELRSMRDSSTHWEWGARGVYKQPHERARVEENTVSWTFIPPSTYELGTWSTSGMAIEVRVDGKNGTIIFYKDGVEGY